MPSAQLLAGLGAAAIVVANVVALRQERLKLLVAYSTVAQIGYLFLMFPLAFDAGAAGIGRGGALAGGLLQAISHATAKAAMFMAAGLVYVALGHDRIAGLAGIGRALPLTVLTFAVAGVALMGLPPSGAYVAKKLFFDAAAGSGQWWWERVLDVGGLLTASYVVLVLAHALRRADAPIAPRKPVSRIAELAALTLALCSLALGFAADGTLGLDALSGVLTFSDLGSAVLVLVGGAVIAAALARDLPGTSGLAVARPLRNATVAIGGAFACADGMLRRWPVAGLALLAATIAFGAALLARA
jgi:NADH:ubiquinone oxidoreductase subunit 5 (subunit L)/multisubunit Na+/H+ antiporter MnhA subunit